MSAHYRYHHSSSNAGLFQCGCYLAILIINLSVGAWNVNYLLDFFLHKMIPIWGAVIIGAFGAEITIPAAIIVAILRVCHILIGG